MKLCALILCWAVVGTDYEIFYTNFEAISVGYTFSVWWFLPTVLQFEHFKDSWSSSKPWQMTQSCWLSSEPLLVLSRVDLLFAVNEETVKGNKEVIKSVLEKDLLPGRPRSSCNMIILHNSGDGENIRVSSRIFTISLWK